MGADALVVFGREPVPGRVKTRLAEEIGDQQACDVYRDLLEHTLDVAVRVDADRFLYLPEGDGFDAGRAFSLRIQAGSDLGGRMDRAFREGFDSGYERIVLVGSDCPYLYANLLQRAFSALLRHETVFGPAADGGYYLVGQRAPARDLFSGIPWSTDRVWRLTRSRLEENNWSYLLLEALEDVDDQSSLRRYRDRISGR